MVELTIVVCLVGAVIGCIRGIKTPRKKVPRIPDEEIILDLHMCGATERPLTAAEQHDKNYSEGYENENEYGEN